MNTNATQTGATDKELHLSSMEDTFGTISTQVQRFVPELRETPLYVAAANSLILILSEKSRER